MTATIAKRIDKPKSSRPSGKHTSPRESFHLSIELQDALESYVREVRPPTDKSAVLRIALEDYLRGVGRWPPPKDPPAPPKGGAKS